ncbi:hypothetical protein SpiGrapes_1960 [Sphaerochaeta pleomorpha str. Grapes]|uniref:Nitrogen fixation protein NifH n=1 Tax=Sphaerochaeta pleomorpha (strain ATCC BAA-1885 / DSM 22778 / Grapes) TaxID=158190 RepID=G8QQA2_SPHPG|nr:nitrogenase subunit NifH [Sphaerochaeta pleomorpha]AEV29747.1 hypothetical protein SpiGrapes_1960 [Sphaerochaeta pleomorpha str. Grapes]
MEKVLIDWLLEENNPSVRFATLTRLLDEPLDDPEVQKTCNCIGKGDVVARILDKQNSDGSWGIPERFYLDKYTGTVWTLLVLSELYAPADDMRVVRACDFILDHSFNAESGGFSTSESVRTKTGLASLVIPCLTGNMVYSLIRCGYLEDERVQRAIEWICTYQRTDDGDDRPPLGPMYDRYRSCWGRHSCHMGVAKGLKALCAIPLEKRNDQVASKIEELCEYFLIHHIFKKSHKLEEVSKPGWLRFGFPLMYQSDVLELMELFADLEIHDSRLDESLELIEKKATSEGKWVLENSYNGRLQVAIEQKGEPSKWLTLKALKVLQEYR